jgi:hypothetical protein
MIQLSVLRFRAFPGLIVFSMWKSTSLDMS